MVNLKKEQRETESVVGCIAQGQLSALPMTWKGGVEAQRDWRCMYTFSADSHCYTSETNTTL